HIDDNGELINLLIIG
ncbi:hypothetical protein D018_1285B, partial [Vibrio parahaemolyticus VP2007-007]